MTLSAGSRLGPYEVISPLGAGGMGEVWKAKDTRLDRLVAIKVLPGSFLESEEGRARFEREAKALAAVNHPGIAVIHSFEEICGRFLLVQELLEGDTLRSVLDRGPVPLRKALDVATQVAEGLAAAHEKGIVHRDLKPENVFVTKDGHAKLLDFGLARHDVSRRDANDTRSPTLAALSEKGVVLGTVAYMSPEQARGEVVDFRSDQFSLGVVLYEMLAGKKPFVAASAPETLTAIIREEPEPLEKLAPKTPAPVRWLVERLLAKEPAERFESTRDLARDLAACRLHLSEATSGATALASTSTQAHFSSAIVLAALAAVLAGVALAFVLVRRAPPPPTFRKLTFGKGDVGSARFMPDGNSVIYNARWEERSTEVFTTRIDNPGVSPFGLQDAYVMAVRGGDAALLLGPRGAGSIPRTLATIPIGGGTPRPILEGVQTADWSPDGRTFAVVKPVSGGQRLEYPPGKALFETAGQIGVPRISPDGRRVAFSHARASVDVAGSVTVVDSEGHSSNLTEGWAGGVRVVWSPTGSEVWFSAGEFLGWHSIYAVNLRGAMRKVLSAPTSLFLMDLSADGRALVASGTATNEIWGKAPGDESERSFSWLDGSGAWGTSSDAKSILFSEVFVGGGRNRSTYLRRLDGGQPMRLGEGRARGLSPDGSWALSVLNIPKPSLFLIPTGAGETRVLPLGTIAAYHWANFFPDGKRILILGNEEGRPRRLFVQDVTDGPPRAIAAEGIWVPEPSSCVSPDGRRIAAIATDRPVLVATEGGEPRPMEGLRPGEQPISWTRDGKTLFVAESAAGRQALAIFRYELASGRREPWRTLRPPDASGAVVVCMPVITLDGDAYYYTVYRGLSNLYLVEGLK